MRNDQLTGHRTRRRDHSGREQVTESMAHGTAVLWCQVRATGSRQHLLESESAKQTIARKGYLSACSGERRRGRGGEPQDSTTDRAKPASCKHTHTHRGRRLRTSAAAVEESAHPDCPQTEESSQSQTRSKDRHCQPGAEPSAVITRSRHRIITHRQTYRP